MDKLQQIGGEPLKGSGFEGEPVITQDGTVLVNGQLILPEQPAETPESAGCADQSPR